MKQITKEEEKRKIEELIKLERKLHMIEMEKPYCESSQDILQNRTSEEKLKESIKQISDELSNLENPLASKEISGFIIKSFNLMKEDIQNIKYNLLVSRSQGLCIENYFASKIIEVIDHVMKTNYGLISSPFMYITHDPEDGIEKERLIDFFDSEIEIISNIDKIDYLKLKDYYDSLIERLRKLIE